MKVEVLLRPPLRRAPAARSTDTVVIDVLRATSTLTVALDRGAGPVHAAAAPEEAFALRARLPGALLCGERDGLRIPGFDLGNSPFEYDEATVRGRELIFASTNGSIAMQAAGGARRRWLGAFINLGALAERLDPGRDVLVICAGKLGRFALEDAACAGLLCQQLRRRGAILEGAGARLATSLAPRDAAEVRSLVQGCAHGRYLRSLGPEFARDVEFCGGLDVMDRAFAV
jgi:2-phosphosulfolactate phosphatase